MRIGKKFGNDGKGEDTVKTEKAKEKEIVVSLKKLEAKIKSDTDIKGKKVKIENQEYTILNIIEKLKNDREKAKKILINWINTYYKSIENNCEELVLIFSLISFYFRNDSSKTITEVKFGEKNSKLLQKTKAWINENIEGDGNNSKENMSQLFEKAKNITEEQREKMANLITAISAGKVERMARKAKKKVKQAVHNAKKRTIGSDNISPDTLEKFNNFWKCFDESKIKELMKERKISEEESSLIKYLSEALYFGEFANKFDDKSELKQLYKIDFPEKFKEGAWKVFVEFIIRDFSTAKAAAEQKAGNALRECYTATGDKYLTDINTIIVNIDQKIESEKELKDALNPVKEKLNKIKEETAKNGDNREVLNKLINELTDIPKIRRQDLVELKCALEKIPKIKEKLPNVEKKGRIVWDHNAITISAFGKQNQTGSNSQQQTAASTADTPKVQQEPSDADKSPGNSQIRKEENVVDGTPSPQAVEAIEMEEDTTPQIRTVEVKKAEKPELEEATVVGNPQGPQPQPQLATKGNFKPTPMQQVTIEKVDLHGQEATVVGNPQGAKPQQHSASQYISKQVEEVLANENITFEGAKRVLDDIKTDEATSHMKTVLAKIPEPIRGNKFPENSELLGVNEDDYKNIKKIWLKAQELAPNESVTGTTPPPKILKPNFPISEAALQATAVEGTQGAEPQPQLEEAEYVDNTTEMKQLKIERVQSLEPNEAIFVDEPIAGEDSHVGQHSQQHGAGDPSLKKAPSQSVKKPKAARMVGRARHSQIGRKGQTNNNRFGIDKKRSKK